MAEIVVSAVVGVLIEKLISGTLMNFARSQGIDSQLNKWKKTLPMIQAVLADAAQKQIKQRAVELWLIELQDLAYDIDDALDDIATEAMKRKFEESQASTRSSSSKLLMIFPSCCTTFTPHNMMYGRKMSSKLDEITTRLHDLVDQKNSLSLDMNVKVERSNKTDVRSQQTSYVNESQVLGREKDKEALIGRLLGNEEGCSNQNVISVVSIVGMGGLGKTTLAQLLYNHQKVKDRFELMAWVCVSDEFDVFNISKQVYQAVGGEDKEFANLDLLHVALKEKLSKKRFLVVLDDVWNEGPKKWDLLRSAFDVGAHGSKFLVTTRKKEVALVMDCFQPYELEILSDEIALSLFAQSALDEQNFDKHPSLKPIAQGIIKKCKGLPLALVTLGKVLKRKGSDDEWEELLNSKIWNLEDESGILPALKLSYYDLPSHLKQVFAYCSLFPKDYEFEKKNLVKLWMAEGFLSQTKAKNQPMESLGGKYFEELLSRSFFQPLGNDESRYIMHDLMMDLATSVAGEFFFRLDENMDLNGKDQAYEKFRHFSSIVQQRGAEYRHFKELHRARCLRTFLRVSIGWGRFNTLDTVIKELLPYLHFLRVLSLSHYSITKVPHCIGNLKHLRYLNFSETDIQQIPEEVSELYNLQTLLVRDCSELSSLAVSFVKLINLRHLDMTNTWSLKKLPLGIGGLTSLQTLSKVIIEGGNGFKVCELKGLMDLKGGLSIEGLDKVIEPMEAKDANLQQKKGLDDLELVWSNVLDDSRDPVIEYEVLERLRAPHSNLKKLNIKGYGGMEFPSWLGDPSFAQLTELVLIGCENCTKLATLEHLTSLRKLEVRNCSKLESIKGEKEVVNVGSSIMGSLRQVKIKNCAALESYCCPNSVERLEISNCSSMTLLSFSKLQEEDFPSSSSSSSSNLKILEVKACKNIKSIGEKEVVNVGSSIMGSLRQVTLYRCESLESYCYPNSVETLVVEYCDSMKSLSFSKWQEDLPSPSSNLKILEVVNVGISIMESLRHVKIENCKTLESYCCPNSVERLEIRGCDLMTSLSFSKLQEEDLPSSSSSNLKFLTINNCKNMKSIFDGNLQSLTYLEEMGIWRWPSMEDSFPSCGGLWPPNLRILKIGELKKPMSEWGLQNYPLSLVELYLYGKNSGVVSFGVMEDHNKNNNTTTSAACFLLPPFLTKLWIWEFEQVESVSEVLQHLPHLQLLQIWFCPKLRDVPETTSSLEVRKV